MGQIMTDESTQFQVSNSDDLLQLVIFKLGTEEFGVDIMQVQEIIRMPEITRIPKSPGYIKGVINLRGKIIVVMNLDSRFHMSSNVLTDESRIIVVDIEGTIVGMVVDSVSEVIRMAGANVDPTPEIISQTINAEYLKGVGKIDDRMLILLDLENVLSETAA
jgi:purine-binding chemotaxis protein CheW